MFIQCSDCNYKYLVNSADLKPNGRMLQCANCDYQWFQKLSGDEVSLSSSVPKTNLREESNDKIIKNEVYNKGEIKNLPSTVVNENKVSIFNSFLVVFILINLVVIFWYLRTYGINIFVLINYYIQEFFFNLKLIIDDFAKIIYQILN